MNLIPLLLCTHSAYQTNLLRANKQNVLWHQVKNSEKNWNHADTNIYKASLTNNDVMYFGILSVLHLIQYTVCMHCETIPKSCSETA